MNFENLPENWKVVKLGRVTDVFGVPLDYNGFRAMIKRAVERHNRRAEKLGLLKITKSPYTPVQILCSDKRRA